MSLKQKTLQTAPSNDTTQPALPVGSGNCRAVFGVCVFLVAAIWVVFGQTLGHEFVNYDDDQYVYKNPQVIHGLNLKGIVWAFTHSVIADWHPLTVMSHMLDCQFYGLHAGGHHLTNLLLHAATAILLFLTLREMTGALWRSAFVAGYLPSIRCGWNRWRGCQNAIVGISAAYAAYSHTVTIDDSANFLAVYPAAKGTKLDSCTTCHASGTPPGQNTAVGSCQYCHAITNYGAIPANFPVTLNPYRKDDVGAGRSQAALTAIASKDSDGDGYSNAVEIAALTYPGDPNDDPTKVPAPSKVYSLKQIEAMDQHAQFLLLNASKSTDTYAQYSGPTMEHVLKPLALPSATQVTVFSPDGFSQTHPFAYDPTLNVYYVDGTYPAATYYLQRAGRREPELGYRVV